MWLIHVHLGGKLQILNYKQHLLFKVILQTKVANLSPTLLFTARLYHFLLLTLFQRPFLLVLLISSFSYYGNSLSDCNKINQDLFAITRDAKIEYSISTNKWQRDTRGWYPSNML